MSSAPNDEEHVFDLLYTEDISHDNLWGEGPFIPGSKPDMYTGWINGQGFISYEIFGKSAARYLAVDELNDQIEAPAPEKVSYDSDNQRLLVSTIQDAFRADQFSTVNLFESVEADEETFYSAVCLKRASGDFDIHPGNLVFKQDNGRVFAVDFHMAASKALAGDSYRSFVERSKNTADYLEIEFDEEILQSYGAEIAEKVDLERFQKDFEKRVISEDLEISNEDFNEINGFVETNIEEMRK